MENKTKSNNILDTVSKGKENWADIMECEEENLKQLGKLNKKFLSKPEITDPIILKLLNVPEDQSSFVRIFDEYPNGLQLVHYISSSNDHVNHLRGVIVATSENPPRVVCKSFPYTPEFLSNVFDMSDEDIAKSVAFEGHEGTILRVFYYDKQWYVSTHKKINGTMSRWSSPTFGELFKECWGMVNKDDEFDFSILNQDYCYVFLMSHPLNRLVCEQNSPALFHVATYDTINNMKDINVQLSNSMVSYPIVLNFGTKKEVIDYVNTMTWSKYSGIILYSPDGKMCKVVNSDYYYRRQIRGNEPNLKLRYLQLERMDKIKPSELIELLPEKKDYFKKVDRDDMSWLTITFDDEKYKHEWMEKYSVNTFFDMFDELKNKFDMLTDKINEMYYAPGMPGYVQSKNDFEKLK